MVLRFNLGESTCKSIPFTIAVASDSRCPHGFADLGCVLSGLGRKCEETVWRFNLGESTSKSTVTVASDSPCPS